MQTKKKKINMATKENNKNTGNINQQKESTGVHKKFLGGNGHLHRKVYEVTSRDSIHQFMETTKAFADYVTQEYTHGGDIRYMIKRGQSSKTTQSKLETHQDFAHCKSDYNSLKLLKILREFVFKSDNRQYKYKAEDQAKRAFQNLRKTPEMSCQEYFEQVKMW